MRARRDIRIYEVQPDGTERLWRPPAPKPRRRYHDGLKRGRSPEALRVLKAALAELGYGPGTRIPAVRKAHQPRGVFVGGCVERGVGSSFRKTAHAHGRNEMRYADWICVRSPRKVYAEEGWPSATLLHEAAHVLTGHGHTAVWRAVIDALGWPEHAQAYEQRYASSRRAVGRRAASEPNAR